jgi:hypothetical protein
LIFPAEKKRSPHVLKDGATKTKINFSLKTNFKQFKVTFWHIGSKTA